MKDLSSNILKIAPFTDDIWEIAEGNGLKNAVTLSLFTDQRSPEGPLFESGGWWADSVTNRNDLKPNFLGSRLWTITRIGSSDKSLGLFIQYAKESLQWLIDEKKVHGLEVEGRFQGSHILLEVTLKIDSATKQVLTFNLTTHQVI